MLKWGLRWLAVFAVLLAIFRVVQDVSNLAVYLLFYALIFSGFLSCDLLLAGLVQRFVTPKYPYLIFIGIVVVVWIGLCCYGYYDMTHDTSCFFPGLLGIFIVIFSTIFQFIVVIGAVIHYFFVGRNKKTENSNRNL
ncbi:hypothetical protein [Streptococcus ferus]|uniref:hypothetical protein n=1 Tax=Streptococcus ferus TaxID=1345 RepID=UPI00359FDF1D